MILSESNLKFSLSSIKLNVAEDEIFVIAHAYWISEMDISITIEKSPNNCVQYGVKMRQESKIYVMNISKTQFSLQSYVSIYDRKILL
jgi:hypothetical protein